MSDDDMLRVLRTLTEAASRFEKAAAKHRRIEAERNALQEAITAAQLFLSVHQRRPLVPGVEKSVPRAKAPSRRGRGVAGGMVTPGSGG
jgi:hypothetical protein